MMKMIKSISSDLIQIDRNKKFNDFANHVRTNCQQYIDGRYLKNRTYDIASFQDYDVLYRTVFLGQQSSMANTLKVRIHIAKTNTTILGLFCSLDFIFMNGNKYLDSLGIEKNLSYRVSDNLEIVNSPEFEGSLVEQGRYFNLMDCPDGLYEINHSFSVVDLDNKPGDPDRESRITIKNNFTLSISTSFDPKTGYLKKTPYDLYFNL